MIYTFMNFSFPIDYGNVFILEFKKRLFHVLCKGKKKSYSSAMFTLTANALTSEMKEHF